MKSSNKPYNLNSSAGKRIKDSLTLSDIKSVKLNSIRNKPYDFGIEIDILKRLHRDGSTNRKSVNFQEEEIQENISKSNSKKSDFSNCLDR